MKRPAISAVGPTASATDPDVLAPHERTRVRRLLNQARHLVLIAVFGLSATMIAAFAWSVAKSVRLIVDLITGGWRDDVKVIEILEVTDSYLLAVVLLIVVIGLYELFIGDLDVPAWLKVRSLDDLKKSIVDVLILFVGVKGVEGLLKAAKPMDALTFTAAAALLIVALSVFRFRSPAPKLDPEAAQRPGKPESVHDTAGEING